MRLNFSFKDAVVRRTNKSSFDIVFDVSKLATKVLSTESRIYVETVNLTEFMDQFSKEDLNGFLEVRCNAIGAEDEWDSSEQNIGDTLIYRSPMENYQVFNNPSPMFLYNFKIQKWFFSKNITFKINFFYIEGKPFDQIETKEKIVDTTHSSYISYTNKVVELETNQDEIDRITLLISTNEQNAVDFSKELTDKEDLSAEALADLLERLKSKYQNAQLAANQTIWRNALIALGQDPVSGTVSSSETTRINWFDNVMNTSNQPYNAPNIKPFLQDTKQKYIDFLKAETDVRYYNTTAKLLSSSQTIVPRLYDAVLENTLANDPIINIQSIFDGSTSFTYTTNGNSKTGTITLEVINIGTFIGVIIKSISPTGADPLSNEEIVISGSQFTPADPTISTDPSNLVITLRSIESKSLQVLENDKLALTFDKETLEQALVYINNIKYVELGQNLNDVIKAMNMSFVIYDEIDPITQASTDAIKGNNYMRVLPCNVKRF